MQHKIKDWWGSRNSQDKNKIKKWGTAICAGTVLFSMYYATGQDRQDRDVVKTERKIEETANMLEDDIRANVKEQVGSVKNSVDAQNEKINALADILDEIAKNTQTFENQHERGSDYSSKQEQDYHAQPTYPVAPPMPDSGYYQGSTMAEQRQEYAEPQIIGGIGRAEGAPKKPEVAAKKKNIIPLPPSFMAAKLLTGVDAMTSELGQSNPETIIFRVQAPAVLPNSLKANLKGCFVVGNATGSLAKERVQVKLVSLHCMSLSGEAVIDQRIKGFVTDRDGKRDMSGIVVTKAGSNLARSFMAGVVGGMGDAVSISSTTTSTSALGSTQVIDPNKALQSGLGQGFKSGSQELQRYYLDLAKQATPVIEVGASKDVTIVIQESVDLEIREFSNADI